MTTLTAADAARRMRRDSAASCTASRSCKSFLSLLLAPPGSLQLLNRRRQLVGQHRKQPHASVDGALQRAERAQRAAAADELDAQSALEPLDSPEMAMTPIAPVRRTCVPPHADRS